ncbi:hypothetical protein J0H58_18945 [bacterium]|nr:hypothetical protein [bacterium]
MDATRRAVLQLAPFEDRVVPSLAGFNHEPVPDPGARAAVARAGPTDAVVNDPSTQFGAYDAAVTRDAPRGSDVVTTLPAREGLGEGGALTRVTSWGGPISVANRAGTGALVELVQRMLAERPDRGAVVALAGSLGLIVLPPVTFLPPSDGHAHAGHGATGSNPGAARPPTVGNVPDAPVGDTHVAAIPPASFVTATEPADIVPPAEAGPRPAAPVVAAAPASPLPFEFPLPDWDFPPLAVDLPAVAPLAGVLGVDLAAVETGVREVLERVAGLGELPADGWGVDGWTAAAVVLAGGGGWAGARARKRRPVPDGVFLGWGERDDRRLG